jgi:hypothetical protein
MRSLRFGLIACCLGLLVAGLFTVGCGGLREDDDTLPGSSGTSGGSVAKREPLKPVKGKDNKYVDIKGTVWWEGEVPKNAPLVFTQDKVECSKGSEYELVENSYWVGGKDGKKRLGNVFVWIEPERGHYFAVPPEQLTAFKDTIVTMHQPHCAFVPHCAVLFPQYYKDGNDLEPTGQKLRMWNDAEVAHNAKVENPRGGNPVIQPTKDATFVLEPDDRETAVSCGVHKWMQGYLRVFPHPYAAVTSVGADPNKRVWQNRTDPNFGTYVIKGAPVGATVTLKAWHEVLGYLPKKTITVKEGLKPEETDFTTSRK